MPRTGLIAGSAVQWLRGFWTFYRGYTHTAAHAAAAAALTAFGLLVFVDRLFVLLAIAAYVGPPLVLYSLGSDVGSDSSSTSAAPADRGTDRQPTSGDSTPRAETIGEADATRGDGDADSDGRDSDTDGRDGDTDSSDVDSDTDSDDGDSDTDAGDGDSDCDG